MAPLTLLHVDLSVVPIAYREWARQASQRGLVWNANAHDIRKTKISSNLLLPDSDWAGRVMVKTDLNYGGRPEATHRLPVGETVWRDAGNPAKREYLVCDSLSKVPRWAWQSPHWVVERFFENQEGASSLWTLTIMGTELELVRFDTISEKVNDRRRYKRWEFGEVDDELRGIVSNLGFDYGRLDLFRIDGAWELLDANKTPGMYPMRHADRDRKAFYEQRICDLAKSVLKQLE